MFEKKKSVWLFLLPGLAMLMIFYIVPFSSGIGYSLTDGSYKKHSSACRIYRDLWQNSMFLLGLAKHDGAVADLRAPLLWLFSFLLASALSAIKPFGGFFRSERADAITPSSAILLVWLVIFDYGGPVNRALEAMGTDAGDVADQRRAATADRADVPVEESGSFCLIIFLAALQSIPQRRSTNTRGWKARAFFTRAFRITLPMVTPTAFLVFVLAWINAFKIFRRGVLHRGRIPGLLGVPPCKTT